MMQFSPSTYYNSNNKFHSPLLPNKMRGSIPSSMHQFRFLGTTFCVSKRYKFIKGVGAGVYGVVVAAIDNQTNTKVAIKKVPKAFDALQDARRIVREIKLLRFCDHKNILSIQQLPTPPTKRQHFQDIYFITELMDTDLHKVIYSPHKLIEGHFQYFMYQIIKGLVYLHSANIIHRDLKPSNILVNANCDIKIADLGLARGLVDTKFLTQYVVTRWYRAPEVLLQQQEYEKAVDVWAAGCVFAELIGRKPLFPGKNAMNQIVQTVSIIGTPNQQDLQSFNPRARKILKNMPKAQKIEWKKLFPQSSDNALDLLDKMLTFDPKKRINIEKCMRHPYFKNLFKQEDVIKCERTIDWRFDNIQLNKENLQDVFYQQAKKQQLAIKKSQIQQQSLPSSQSSTSSKSQQQSVPTTPTSSNKQDGLNKK